MSGGEAGEAGDGAGVGVLLEGLGDCRLEVVCGGTGGSELAEQGEGLPSDGLLDEGELAHLRLAQGVAEPGGLR